jgi:predicted TIM-barrel fold metal-dependent hydrolase
MRIVDVHTHAFPDVLAEKAMKTLEQGNGPYKPFTNGTVRGLLASMDEAGIHSSFVLNIATKPEQAAPIRKWSKEISSDRIIPLGSVHPESLSWQEDIEGFKADGMKGLKFQPMYQGFAIDDKRMFPIYEHIAACKMFVIFHTGEDIAFPGNAQSSVDKMANVIRIFPRLKIVAAHFGGWRSWTAVRQELCGKNVFIETSFIHEVEPPLRDDILSAHDRQRFLFGTDSPWSDQKAQVQFIKNLPAIDDGFKDGILFGNAGLLLHALNE